MTVTIGIKALNEERHIVASVSSALAAVAPFDGEVLLADSGSTDRTVELAKQFPIRIIQAVNPLRSCGAGAQLAFQHVTSDYFYLLDGDMVMAPDFLQAGIAYLEKHSHVAGVGGHVREANTVNPQFQIRERAKRDHHWQPGIVDRLDCGGLYRTAAIRDVGFLADRNLHAFEEFDLGARLKSRGWLLARIDRPAVDHFGHTASGYGLLWRRVKSGYAGAAGEALRGAVGQRHLGIVLRRLAHVRNTFLVMLWWVLLVATAPAPGWWIPLLVAPLLLLWLRRGSPRVGVFSFISWNVETLAFLEGFFRRRLPPDEAIESVELAVAPRPSSRVGERRRDPLPLTSLR